MFQSATFNTGAASRRAGCLDRAWGQSVVSAGALGLGPRIASLWLHAPPLGVSRFDQPLTHIPTQRYFTYTRT